MTADLIEEQLDLSIVVPCLNEVETLRELIERIQHTLLDSSIRYEIIISDNGSEDGSRELVVALGARLIDAKIRGYGAALNSGIEAARGKWILIGDADLSYDFGLVKDFYKYHDSEYDLILGSRLKGKIQAGAMPFLNRHLGTPVLNLFIRLLFKLKCSDCNSGMRFFKKDFYKKLNMFSTGMEWASELLIKTAIYSGKYYEIPINFFKDKRSRSPHLRRWRDGWRHLKTIVLYKPDDLILYPSIAALLLSLLLQLFGSSLIISFLFFNIAIGGVSLSFMVKLILYLDGVDKSKYLGKLVNKPFGELCLLMGVLLILISLFVAIQFQVDWIVLYGSSMAAQMIVLAFFWGTFLARFRKNLNN